MKYSKATLVLIFLPIFSWAQHDTLDLDAYFSAFIVIDMDTSIHWYRNILGFELIDRVESHERGFKISNLQRGENMIELIQLDSAIDPKNVVPEFNSKIRILGIFKTGYQVSDFDEWIIHLKEKKVEFYGNIVTDTNTNKRTVILTDPDGNRFQLFEK